MNRYKDEIVHTASVAIAKMILIYFTLQTAHTLLSAAAFDFNWLPAGKRVSASVEGYRTS